MGNTCKPMAVSFQCMTKFTTNKKKKKKRKEKKREKTFKITTWICLALGFVKTLHTLTSDPVQSSISIWLMLKNISYIILIFNYY